MADPIAIELTRSDLQRIAGGRDGAYPFLETITWDIVHFRDEFWGDEIRGSGGTPGMYEVVTGSDGAINILANQPNGVAEIRASNGDGGDNEYAGISLPELAFTGNRNAVFAARVAIDTITTVKVEIGFTDVTTDAGGVNVKATPSFTANDFVGWVLDTDDNANWEGLGVAATTAVTTHEAAIAPTAATFETMIVALRDSNARFVRLNTSGLMTHDSGWLPSFVTSTVALVPWLFIQLRTGTIDRNLQVDFVDVRARRTT